MLRTFASVSALCLATSTPFAALAAGSGSAVCASAAADPAAFMQRGDLAAAFAEMSGACPELAATLMSTGTVPAPAQRADNRDPSRGTTTGGGTGGAQTPDYGDLMDRLAVATDRLDDATADVGRAQSALDRTIRRASRAGLSEPTLRLVAALASDDLSRDEAKRILPDYTEAKRRALENYLDARDRLETANARLDTAKKAAEPLVAEAARLSGLAATAQSGLAGALDGLSAEARKAALENAIAAAKGQLDALDDRIAALDSSIKDANAALEDAAEKIGEAESKVGSETQDVKNAEGAVATATAEAKAAKDAYDAAFDTARDCKGKCEAEKDARDAAKNAWNEAKTALTNANATLTTEKDQLATAQTELATVKATYDLAALQSKVDALASDLAQAKAQEGSLKSAIAADEGKITELASLLDAAEKAMQRATEASEQARAATAGEEADVASAKAALETALTEAQAALAGSPAETEALQDVLDAQAELARALGALGAAQDEAEKLANEVAAIPDAPDAVSDAAGDLAKAGDAGTDMSQAADETARQAEEAVADHDEARKDLEKALAEPAAPTGEAPAES